MNKLLLLVSLLVGIVLLGVATWFIWDMMSASPSISNNTQDNTVQESISASFNTNDNLDQAIEDLNQISD